MNTLRHPGLLFCCIVLLVSGCHKKKFCASSGYQGEWIWESSIGGIGGWTYTPENTGFTARLEWDELAFREWKADSLVRDTGYDLRLSDEPLLGTESRILLVLDTGEPYAAVLDKDTLVLIEQYYDGFAHRYRRK